MVHIKKKKSLLVLTIMNHDFPYPQPKFSFLLFKYIPRADFSYNWNFGPFDHLQPFSRTPRPLLPLTPMIPSLGK